MAKFEITNPEAIKLISDIKSGVYFKPVIEKVIKIKWYLISFAIFIVLIIFFAIGKSLSSRAKNPVYLPPKLDLDNRKVETSTPSQFDSLKMEISGFSTDLPDPVFPDFDNKINLQSDEN